MITKNKLKFFEAGGYWDLSWRQFRKSTFAMAGLIISVVLLIMAGAALLKVMPADPFTQDLDRIVQPMSARHWFGTDDLGRESKRT